MPSFFKIHFFSAILLFVFFACDHDHEKSQPVQSTSKSRVFPGYHSLLDEIIRSNEGVFRGLKLNANAEQIKAVEPSPPEEFSEDHLYYEYKPDSITHYSIDYSLSGDSLDEINVQINISDLELSSYLFCDLKDYYANKLPNPTEDKGYVVYNCFEGQRKPFVVSLSDNSSPNQGIINMVIYKDK